MTKKQTLNSERFREQAAQRSTLNAQLGRNLKLDVERWTLSVGRFLPGLP